MRSGTLCGNFLARDRQPLDAPQGRMGSRRWGRQAGECGAVDRPRNAGDSWLSMFIEHLGLHKAKGGFNHPVYAKTQTLGEGAFGIR